MKSFLKLILLFTLIFISNSCSSQQVTKEEFAKKLLEYSITSNSNYMPLLKAIEKDEITKDIHFLNYCNKGIIIELAKYSDTPDEYIEKIHKVTSKILPTLNFSDFSYKIEERQTPYDYKSYKLIVSIKCNNQVYSQESFIQPNYLTEYKNNEHMKFFGKIGDQYYQIFNKILADKNSKYRLHIVKSILDNMAYYNDFGIIALTKDQAKMLHSGGVYFSPSFESFKNTINSNKIDYAFKKYSELGLIKVNNEEHVDSIKKKIKPYSYKNINDILQRIPMLTYNFDAELGNLENPYEEILKELELISKNQFKVSSIKDNFNIERKKCKLRFLSNSKIYEKVLTINNDWIDPDVFDLVNLVLEDSNSDFKLHFLYTGDQMISLIFLTDNQENTLRKEKLAYFSDQWKEIEK